jgi:CheY-like chemotaxis protein
MEDMQTLPRRALLVEAESADRALVADALREQGWEVVAVAEESALAAALGQAPFGVAVLGLLRPGPSGRELVERLRRGQIEPLAIVLVGGEAMDPGTEKARQEAHGFLKRPLRPAEVDELLEHVLPGNTASLAPSPTGREARPCFGHHQLVQDGQSACTSRAPLSLNDFLREQERMLHHLLRPQIELVTALDPALGLTEANPGRLGQMLLNLVLHARDAMPQGGRLTLTTARHTVGPSEPGSNLPPGDYVTLAVTDTGVGMDVATRARLFEPFFTTQWAGQQAGLGLALVAEVVEEHGGLIRVFTEPGRGTTITLYLPRLPPALPAQPARAPVSDPPAAKGATVLVVEDNQSVRNLVVTVLSRAGYTVLEAESGAAALELCGQYPGRIQLLITDLILPQMTGSEVAQAVGRLQPGLKVVLMSGYPPTEAQLAALPGAAFLAKPFTGAILLRPVRALLGERDPRAPRS